MAYHTYEEAGITGPPMTPHSPSVPSRVPETRYSRMPGEVIVCADGYSRYRPSISSEQIADYPQPNLNRMYRTLPRPSGSTPNIFIDDDSSAGRIRSYSLSTGVYTDVNPVRPMVVAQDGYAEYLSDDTRNRSRSYSELYTRNQTRPSSPNGYTRYKSPKKPPVYTDLTTGQSQPDGYARYNASIHQHQSTYTDLRTGQDRRLPSPPTDYGMSGLDGMTRRHKSLGSLPSLDEAFHEQIMRNNSDYTDLRLTKDRRLPSPPVADNTGKTKIFVQRQVSVGSLPSINEALDESASSEASEHIAKPAYLRIDSSSSDNSAYTNPTGDIDEGSLSYEEVGPDMRSPAPGV